MTLQEYLEQDHASLEKFEPGEFIIFSTGAGMYLDDSRTWNFHPGPVREEPDWDAASPVNGNSLQRINSLSKIMSIVLQMNVMTVNRYPNSKDRFETSDNITPSKTVLSKSAVNTALKIIIIVLGIFIAGILIFIPDQLTPRTICFMLAMLYINQSLK